MPIPAAPNLQIRASAVALVLLLALAVGEVGGGEALLHLLEVAAPGWVAFAMVRWLRERDRSRDGGDQLARSLLDHLQQGIVPALAKALIDYHNAPDGPCWALPPGKFMITRYDWARHRTVPVAVFPDKSAAEA